MSDDDNTIEFRDNNNKEKNDIDRIIDQLDINNNYMEKESGAEPEDAGKAVEKVNEILRTGIEKKASNIHFESFKDQCIYRFEAEGTLSKEFKIDPTFNRQMIARLKVMAGCDLSERRLPQDGKIKVKLKGDDDIHLFMAFFLPTISGENATLRIIRNPSDVLLNLSDQAQEAIMRLLHGNAGLIVLMSDNPKRQASLYYSVMNIVSDSDKRVINIDENASEEMLEKLHGVIHIKPNPAIGYDSNSAFRASIRVSPKVIMVNDINTKDFIDCFHAFIKSDFNFIISVKTDGPFEFMIQAQSQGLDLKDLILSRPLFIGVTFYDELCAKCFEETSISEEDRDWIEKMGFEVSESNLRKGKGCESCLGTGFSGRQIQEEILLIEDDVINSYRQGLDVATASLITKSVIKIPDDQTIISRILKGSLSHENLSKVRKAVDKWNRP